MFALLNRADATNISYADVGAQQGGEGLAGGDPRLICALTASVPAKYLNDRVRLACKGMDSPCWDDDMAYLFYAYHLSTLKGAKSNRVLRLDNNEPAKNVDVKSGPCKPA